VIGSLFPVIRQDENSLSCCTFSNAASGFANPDAANLFDYTGTGTPFL
jgi:hypothetical protein